MRPEESVTLMSGLPRIFLDETPFPVTSICSRRYSQTTLQAPAELGSLDVRQRWGRNAYSAKGSAVGIR